MNRGLAYRTKLITFILCAVTLVFMAGLYNSISSRVIFSETRDLLVLSQQLTVLEDSINAVQDELEAYLSTRSSDSLQNFYDVSNDIKTNNDILRQSGAYTPRGIKIQNLSGMVDHYIKTLDATVIGKRNDNTAEYIAGYGQANKEYGYIGSYIRQIMSGDLSESAAKYIVLQRESDTTTLVNYIILCVTLAVITAGTILFGFQVTKPISELADHAKEVSNGNFDVEISGDASSREMNFLFRAFRQMTENIKNHVEELKEKQRLEQKLSEVEINNLKMETSLREAELHALQYQVNPHFIFNTINIGAKIAMLQGDKTTCEYLENTAEVFRYNLRAMDVDVTLRDEIQNVIVYMKLLTTRFGSFLCFEADVPEDGEALNTRIPSMTLQPLVENAYIHGVSKTKKGGEIKLTVSRNDGFVSVGISNTGPPIPPGQAAEILSGMEQKKVGPVKKGHTTNIGMVNVLKRLRLYYGMENVMSIICGGGRTNVILRLPLADNGQMGAGDV